MPRSNGSVASRCGCPASSGSYALLTTQVMCEPGYRARNAESTGSACTTSPRALGLMIAIRSGMSANPFALAKGAATPRGILFLFHPGHDSSHPRPLGPADHRQEQRDHSEGPPRGEVRQCPGAVNLEQHAAEERPED